MSRRVAKSLRMQLFFTVLISIAVGVLTFVLAFTLGNTGLDRTVYGNSFSGKKTAQQFERLQSYVEEEAISEDNIQRIGEWCDRRRKVYLIIYKDDELLYESPFLGGRKNKLNVQELSPDMEDPENEYTLTLQGDVKVRSFLYYYAGDAFYFWMLAISGMLAFIAFSLCFISLVNRKISYIKLLQEELDILSGGQLEYAVTISGCDELGELALGIEQMRRSIIKHQEIENQIRSSNSELITAVSHDLRTPLTSLLAYLEIIERKKYSDEEQMYTLIHKSIGQTMRIKNMADKLFEYFLVYATEWESADMEAIDADQLFQQILEEYAYSLESSGLKVEMDFAEVSGQINVNIELLQRALDNLYSNLLKYATSQQPIHFAYKREDSHFLLSISNAISSKREMRESTSIGLKTCRRIIEYHGGSFLASEENGIFTVKIELPL